jgi:ABC-type Fe3+/spermidine/putrescine transport system ATPase subunit
VFENVGFGLRRQGVAEAEIQRRVMEALGQVRLAEFAQRAPSQLSGGQQQRVALARTLVLRPRVLLLDEPLGALDHQLRLQMQVELKQLQRECGITFIFVTHDQPEALTMSDRIAVLSRGKIEQVGTAWEVYERPATEFVARFLGASNLLGGAVREVGSDVTVALDDGPTVGFPNHGRRWETGQRVKVMLRPEWLTVSHAPPGGGWVSVPVSVRDRIYQGSVTRWTVGGLGPDPLEVCGTPVMAGKEGENLVLDDVPPGSAATLSWKSGMGVVLPGAA